MDAPATPHPTDQILHSYGLGKLGDTLTGAVESHLESCPDCRSRLAGLSSDTFLGRLRDAQKTTGQSVPGASPLDGTLSLMPAKSSTPPPVDSLPPGLADHADYEIKRELGRGGMGVVYLAHNAMMGRDEVLKVIGRQVMERPGVLDRFLREIRAVARLRHPNIVTAYTAFRIEGGLVFAMEYVEGLDLSRLVKAKGPLPVAHAAYFVHQAALGLQHAHEKGMVHRDIKPHNLMLTHDGKARVVKILDFGLAKASREQKVDGGLTSEGQALGTPDYIAPEQILNAQDADIRADLYSLGGTLFYLLTGRPPFQANSLYDLYQAHISRDVEPLNLVRPEVPSELAALVSKMMAKDPDRRFQTPGDVSQTLAPFFRKANAAYKRPETDLSRAGKPNVGLPTAGVGSTSSRTEADSGKLADRVKDASGTTVAEPNWESLIEFRKAEESVEAVPVTKPKQRPPWLWQSVAAGLLLCCCLAAWIVGGFKVRTPDGVIALENLPNDTEVFIDGSRITVSWPGGGRPVEIRAVPGEHLVEVKKAGFKTFGAMVTFQAEGHAEIVVRLEGLDFSRPGGTGEFHPPRPPKSPFSVPRWSNPAITIAAHRDLIWCIAFDPEGRRLASVGEEGAVRIWDADTGKMIKELAKEVPGFSGVAWSSDGKVLAASGTELGIRLFDGITGEPSRISKINADRPRCVAISVDSKFIAAGGNDNLVKVWDLATGELRGTLQGHTSLVFGVAFSHDGKSIASTSWDRTVRLWDASTGKERHRFEGHQGDVLHVEFSPDDQTLATSSWDSTVRLWNVDGGPERLILRANKSMGRAWCVAYSPDGRFLAAGSDQGTRFWDAASGLENTSTPASDSNAYWVTFSADGRRLAIAENSENRHQIKVWDLKSARLATASTPTMPAPTFPRPTPTPVDPRPAPTPVDPRPVPISELYIKGNVVTRGTSRGPVNVEIFDEQADPLRSLACPKLPASLKRRPALVLNAIRDEILSSGIYEGGIHISGICNVHLEPGVYVLRGGGFSLEGNCTLSGTEIVILNIPTRATDVINVHGRMEITPPTSLRGVFQPFNGISIYQPPISNAPIKLDGNSEITLGGTLYAPGARLTIGGNSQLHINRDAVGNLPGRAILSELTLEGNGGLLFNAPSRSPRPKLNRDLLGR